MRNWSLASGKIYFSLASICTSGCDARKKSIRTHHSLPYTFQNLQMLNLLAITLLAVIVKNPSMMQNMNSAIENYDDVKLAEA
jgi:hypothetical protein